jgi:hypothetical protein
MYCLTFKENNGNNVNTRNFYYHNYLTAMTTQRTLLTIEIEQLLIDDETYYGAAIKFESCSNRELQRLLTALQILKYRDDFPLCAIDIKVSEVKCEDHDSDSD